MLISKATLAQLQELSKLLPNSDDEHQARNMAFDRVKEEIHHKLAVQRKNQVFHMYRRLHQAGVGTAEVEALATRILNITDKSRPVRLVKEIRRLLTLRMGQVQTELVRSMHQLRTAVYRRVSYFKGHNRLNRIFAKTKLKAARQDWTNQTKIYVQTV